MDISRIERRLKKINAVLEAFKEDNKISNIEKDLLLGYVRELYDLIRESDFDIIEVSDQKNITHSSVKEEPITKTEVVKTSISAIKQEEVIAEIEEKKQVIVESKKTENEEKKPESKSVVEKMQTNSSAISEEIPGVSKSILSLFKNEEVTDISEKLSNSKITDISKVLGINERMYMIAELFNGDKKLFDSSISKLNSLDNFVDAKALIINELAVPNRWDEEDKIKAAQSFVRQVRRKFL